MENQLRDNILWTWYQYAYSKQVSYLCDFNTLTEIIIDYIKHLTYNTVIKKNILYIQIY